MWHLELDSVIKSALSSFILIISSKTEEKEMKNIFVSKLLFQEQVSAPAGEQLEVVAAVCSAAVLQSPAQLQQLQQVEAVLQWTW